MSLAAAGDPRIAEGTRDIERWLAEYPGFIAQHPYVDAYPELVADPAGVVLGVYEHFALPLDGVEAALRAWLDDPGHRGDRFGKWTYDLGAPRRRRGAPPGLPGRAHLLFYGCAPGYLPLDQPPANWPASPVGRGSIPEDWATWRRYWD